MGYGIGFGIAPGQPCKGRGRGAPLRPTEPPRAPLSPLAPLLTVSAGGPRCRRLCDTEEGG